MTAFILDKLSYSHLATFEIPITMKAELEKFSSSNGKAHRLIMRRIEFLFHNDCGNKYFAIITFSYDYSIFLNYIIRSVQTNPVYSE